MNNQAHNKSSYISKRDIAAFILTIVPPFKKHINSYNLHELISIFLSYTCLRNSLNDKILLQLYEIIPIRNKIAHSLLITEHEYDELQKVYKIMIDKLRLNQYDIKAKLQT